MLVALREWASQYRGRRIQLAVRTDNFATLTCVSKMQPHSANLGVIAREMALDVSHLSYAPDIISHIPGIINSAADTLSRQFEPRKAITGNPCRPFHS